MTLFRFHKTYILATLLIFMIEVGIAIYYKSGFIRHTFGDFLATIFVYLGIQGFTHLNPNKSAILTLCIAFAVEFLQLTSFLSFLNLEQYKLAHIVFGTSFHVSDLVAYTLGLATIYWIDTKAYQKDNKPELKFSNNKKIG